MSCIIVAALVLVTGAVDVADGAAEPVVAEPERFGARGQFVPSGYVDVLDRSEDDFRSTLTIRVAPALLYMVARNVAVGVGLRLGAELEDRPRRRSVYSLRVAPTAGYNLQVSEHVSFFPGGSVGVYWVRYGSDALAGLTDNSVLNGTLFGMDVTLYAPLLYHVGNFFLGAGPYNTFDLISDYEGRPTTKTVIWGITTTIGGWL